MNIGDTVYYPDFGSHTVKQGIIQRIDHQVFYYDKGHSLAELTFKTWQEANDFLIELVQQYIEDGYAEIQIQEHDIANYQKILSRLKDEQ